MLIKIHLPPSGPIVSMVNVYLDVMAWSPKYFGVICKHQTVILNVSRLIDMIQSKGPSMLPCGIPIFTEDLDDNEPFTFILCIQRLKRTLSPHFRNLPLLHITIRLHLTWRLLKFMQWLARKQYLLRRQSR